MDKETSHIRISDIARMAGVSVGTVDRVIHNRGRVSEENERKVKVVLDRVNYQPNLLARSLASKKQYRLIAIIPSFEKGEYWEAISDGIDRAAEESEPYNVSVRKLFFNQYDPQSFDNMMDQFPDEGVDGVVIATLFTNFVIDFSKQLDAKEIPYVYLDSNIPGQHQLAYFGTESYDAGLIAAKLLTARLVSGSDILIGKIVHSGESGSNQGVNRRNGFCNYLRESGFDGIVHEVELMIDNPLYNFSKLDELIQANPQINGAVIFNSTCYILGDYLKERGLKNIALVGYDLIDKNIRLMSEEIITALIAQRPEQQGYNSIKALSNHLVLKQTSVAANLMPIDILIKENLSYYMNNKF